MTASRLRQFAALLLAFVLTPAAYAAVTCGGWSASAADRHACCAAMNAGCASVSADACCAEGEQRQNLETAAAVRITPGVTVSQPVPARPRLPRSFLLDPRSLVERPHLYLLDSVFLI